MSSALNFTVAQLTHTGLKRQDNQDEMAWFSLPEGELFIVVDGMGGAVGGKTAATMAVAAIHQNLADINGTIAERLSCALTEANRQIHAKSAADQRYHGMGTTAVVVLVGHDGFAHVAHVGDSRLYLYRNGCLQQITKDHTVLQRRIDNGLITAQEAKNAKDGHILSRALGPLEEVQPEVRQEPLRLQPDDLVLMCTDGLSDAVDDHHIQAVVGRLESIDQAGSDLIDAALQAGGADNITVQLIAVENKRSAVHSTAPLLSGGPPAIQQPAPEYRTPAWKRGWLWGAVGAIVVVLVIALGVADGRTEVVFKCLQTKSVKATEPSAQRIPEEKAHAPAPSKSEAPHNELRVHDVAPGDTLDTIARRYGMSLERLLQINGLAADRPIFPGQTLVVHRQ